MAKQRRSVKERKLWHYKMSRVGAKNSEGRLLSDFERGKHLGIADTLHKTSRNYAINQHNKKQKMYEKLFA